MKSCKVEYVVDHTRCRCTWPMDGDLGWFGTIYQLRPLWSGRKSSTRRPLVGAPCECTAEVTNSDASGVTCSERELSLVVLGGVLEPAPIRWPSRLGVFLARFEKPVPLGDGSTGCMATGAIESHW
jgi:hypothetical protein